MSTYSRIIFKFGAALTVLAVVLISIGYLVDMLTLEQARIASTQIIGSLLLITIGAWLLGLIVKSR